MASSAQPWQIPAVLMYGRLAYMFEGMTDMINGAFMEDLSELLNSATGLFDALSSRESTSDNDSQARYGGQGQGRLEES